MKTKDCYNCKYKSKVYTPLPYMYCQLKDHVVKSAMGIKCKEWASE